MVCSGIGLFSASLPFRSPPIPPHIYLHPFLTYTSSSRQSSPLNFPFHRSEFFSTLEKRKFLDKVKFFDRTILVPWYEIGIREIGWRMVSLSLSLSSGNTKHKPDFMIFLWRAVSRVSGYFTISNQPRIYADVYNRATWMRRAFRFPSGPSCVENTAFTGHK